MKVYLVGGAVRDELLEVESKDKDWVVVGATPDMMKKKGFEPVGKNFPVFINKSTMEEYALARTERKEGHGYYGFTFYAEPQVTLEEDLKRRDLTINAMAKDLETNTLIDPYDGQQDLKDKLLRHVSPAFQDDPLRVLRVARFAARFHYLHFTIAPETLQLMQNIANMGELEYLIPERVWQETYSALGERNPEVYFQTLEQCGVFEVLFPELAGGECLDAALAAKMLQYTPEAQAFEFNDDLESAYDNEKIKIMVRFVCFVVCQLLNGCVDIETMELQAKQFCQRFRVPSDFKKLLLLTVHLHQDWRELKLDADQLLNFIEQTDPTRKPLRFELLKTCLKQLDFQKQDVQETSYQDKINWLIVATKAFDDVPVAEIVQTGLKGEELNNAIQKERLQKINQAIQSG